MWGRNNLGLFGVPPLMAGRKLRGASWQLLKDSFGPVDFKLFKNVLIITVYNQWKVECGPWNGFFTLKVVIPELRASRGVGDHPVIVQWSPCKSTGRSPLLQAPGLWKLRYGPHPGLQTPNMGSFPVSVLSPVDFYSVPELLKNTSPLVCTACPLCNDPFSISAPLFLRPQEGSGQGPYCHSPFSVRNADTGRHTDTRGMYTVYAGSFKLPNVSCSGLRARLFPEQ